MEIIFLHQTKLSLVPAISHGVTFETLHLYSPHILHHAVVGKTE